MPSWTNTFIYPGGRDDPEIKAVEAAMSHEWFMERFGGIPTPPRGTVFHEFRNHIHTGLPDTIKFDAALPVYLWVDPGYDSAYAVEVIQIKDGHVHIIDEIYERRFVTSDIIKICKQRPWWNKVLGGSIDIAARQHQGMPAVIEIWNKEAGINLRSQKLPIRDGIEAVKRFLIVNPITGSAMLHISTSCRGIISEMGGCPNPLTGATAIYSWHTDNNGNVVGEAPEDKNNHASKALAYGIVDMFGFTERKSQVSKVNFI